MCLIVDINVAHDVLKPDGSDNYAPIRIALMNRKATLIYGGKLAEEYITNGAINKLILAFDRAGIAKRYPAHEVNSETETVITLGLCKSNDEHIIALARVSRARVLCTNDEMLRTDFRNPRLISNPRGSIFSNKQHKHILHRHCE